MTATKPRIGMNLLWCVPGGVGGSEEYFVRQLVGLSDVDHDFQITPYVLQGFVEAHPEIGERYGEIAVAPIDGRSRPRRIVAESTWLAAEGRRRGEAMMHHGGGTMPRRGVRPAVLTIHDLQYLTYPHYFSKVKLAYLTRRMPISARRAAVVAVPSEYVRASVIEHLRLVPERVVVVPHGLEPHIGASATPEDELRQRCALGDGPVLVYAAATFPHKRHDFLIDMMNTQWRDPDLRLVFIGGRGLAEDAVVARSTGRIKRLPRVSVSDRDGLIRLADAVVVPSEYEGFGAPVIEAMALGTPVIASDRTAIPEVLGDAGLSLPLDPAAWAGALDIVRGRRSELVAAGIRRAAQFTAAHSATALLAAYRLALACE
jgi:glycosyltransferase involved in cell wall biosynthesis